MSNVQIPQRYDHARKLRWIFHENKYFSSTGIRAHDLPTHIFLPVHYLPNRDVHRWHLEVAKT